MNTGDMTKGDAALQTRCAEIDRKFRRAAIVLAVLLGFAVIIIYPLATGSPVDPWAFGVGGLAGLGAAGLLWLLTRGIGVLAVAFIQGTRFERGSIAVAVLSGIAVLIAAVIDQPELRSILVGLVCGAIVCVLALTLASIVEWVLEGFRRGKGRLRVAVLVASLVAISALCFVFGVEYILVTAMIALLAWTACGFRRDLPLRSTANRVGWSVGIVAYVALVGSESLAPTLKEHPLLKGVVPIALGLAARMLTIFIGTAIGRAPKAKA